MFFFGALGSDGNILLNGQEFVSYLIEALYFPGFKNRAGKVEPQSVSIETPVAVRLHGRALPSATALTETTLLNI